MMLSHSELIARMALGALLGGVIGYERDRHGRPVGLRTHMLVALSAALFMVVSTQFAYYQHFNGAAGIEVDASRIAASVVSAIGFLAGGSILRTGVSIAGLTTAAGLWLVTAIGLCAGAGMYVESVTGTAFGIIALTLVRRFEDKDDHLTRRRVMLGLSGDIAATSTRMLEAVIGLGGKVFDTEYERDLRHEDQVTLTIDVTLPVRVNVAQLVAALEAQPGLTHIRVFRTLS
jgi:putative Mg2+ transporter-C (MgtC) family protein